MQHHFISKLLRHAATEGVAGTTQRAIGHAGFVYERWREARLDRRWGAETTERVHADRLDQGNVGRLGGYGYQGVSEARFAAITRALRQRVPSTAGYTFFDVGAGKGRAMMLAAQGEWRRVCGVELSKEMADAAVENFRAFRGRFPRSPQIHLAQGNALEMPLPDGPMLVFLYNPFGADVLSAFVQHLRAHLHRHGGDVWVAYCNPLHQAVLSSPDTARWITPVERHDEWVLYRTVPSMVG
jgi:SAM-dependent methyltransferase